jgi:hypothetical protein
MAVSSARPGRVSISERTNLVLNRPGMAVLRVLPRTGDRKWFSLRPVGLEIFPSEEDYDADAKGPDYTMIPIALLSLARKCAKAHLACSLVRILM